MLAALPDLFISCSFVLKTRILEFQSKNNYNAFSHKVFVKIACFQDRINAFCVVKFIYFAYVSLHLKQQYWSLDGKTIADVILNKVFVKITSLRAVITFF